MNSKYCTNCGILIGLAAKFCPSCGAPQTGEAAKNIRAKDPAVTFIPEPIRANGASSGKQDINTGQNLELIPKQKLSPHAIWSFFFSYLAKTSILLLAFIFGIYFEPLIFSLIIAIYLILVYASAAVIYSSFHYAVDEVGFSKSYGILHTQQVTIPYQRIQNVNINRSLGDQMLGIARISIETAGNSAGAKIGVVGGNLTTSEGHLPGVTIDEAKNIHDLLLANQQRLDSGASV